MIQVKNLENTKGGGYPMVINGFEFETFIERWKSMIEPSHYFHLGYQANKKWYDETYHGGDGIEPRGASLNFVDTFV